MPNATPHIEQQYPHAGGCPECRATGVRNSCGQPFLLDWRCTNGRCRDCHESFCPPGGNATKGHGYGTRGRVA